MHRNLRHIEHPEEYMTGTRVLCLLSRRKDVPADLEGEHYRHRSAFGRVSNSPAEFKRFLEELDCLANPYERIYASLSEINVEKAGRAFKHRMIDSTYDPDKGRSFLESLESRWHSCLMQDTSIDPSKRRWLFDCDSVEDIGHVLAGLEAVGIDQNKVYHYPTASGRHVVIPPVRRDLLPPEAMNLLKTGSNVMLWAYPKKQEGSEP